MTRQLHAEGLAGLENRRSPGPPRLLSAEQKALLAHRPEAVDRGRVRGGDARRGHPRGRARAKPLEIRFQDEARVGQQGTLTRVWAKRVTRPRAVRDVEELYDVAALPGVLRPMAIGFRSEEIRFLVRPASG